MNYSKELLSADQIKRVVSVICFALIASTGLCAVTQIGDYDLGEAGSVGASAPYNPLIDSIAPANNITDFQNMGGTRSIVTTGLAAPGSTAALGSAGDTASGWHSNGAYGLTNNWSIDIWIRPDTGNDEYAFTTENDKNSDTGITVRYQIDGQVVIINGNNNGTSQAGTGYTLGTWQRVSIIAKGGATHFYVDGSFISSATRTNRKLNNPMLAFGPGGNAGIDAVFDKLRVWSFDAADSFADIESAMGLSGTIEQIGEYGLGESGTVAASAPYTPLEDSIAPANNITSYQGGTDQEIITTGLSAPGSTAALQKTTTAGNEGWHDGAEYGLTDNWSLEIWLRPDSTAGTYIGATDNDTSNGLTFWAANNNISGTSLGGKTITVGTPKLVLRHPGSSDYLGSDACNYASGEWHRISIIVLNGMVYYYFDRSLEDSATMISHDLDNPMLGFGPGASTGKNAAFDEMKIWRFWPGAELRDITLAMDLRDLEGTVISVQ